MKLKKLYLFIIILVALAFCCTLGNSFYEGMTNKENSKVVTGPQGQVVVATNKNTVQGINKKEIPAGHEDLYILKSQVVPPVCPACPSSSACPREKPCPACPPCGRCPEPAFECKKVPNYNSANTNYLPRPITADFSQFSQ